MYYRSGCVVRLLFQLALCCAGPSTLTHLVEIFTSDLEGAESLTDMIITFDGAIGQAGPYELANDDGRRFMRDAYSQYHLDLPDIGALDHVIIQQQQRVRGSAGTVGLWHLGWISVTNLSTHHTTFFPCDRCAAVFAFSYIRACSLDSSMLWLCQPSLAGACIAA